MWWVAAMCYLCHRSLHLRLGLLFLLVDFFPLLLLLPLLHLLLCRTVRDVSEGSRARRVVMRNTSKHRIGTAMFDPRCRCLRLLWLVDFSLLLLLLLLLVLVLLVLLVLVLLVLLVLLLLLLLLVFLLLPLLLLFLLL